MFKAEFNQGLLKLKFTIEQWTAPNCAGGCLVRISGSGRDAQQEMSTVTAISAMISAALTWHTGDGLIVDLSEFEYHGGDWLFRWESIIPLYAEVDTYPVSIVIGRKNATTIRSLVEESWSLGVNRFVFESVENAVQAAGQ